MKCRILLPVFFVATAAFAQEEEAAPDPVAVRVAYARTDGEMNTLWKELKEKLEASEFAELQEGQRLWLEYRDYMAEWNSDTGAKEKGSQAVRASVGFLETATGVTEARVEYLKAFLTDAPDSEAWAGEWVDSYGGRLQVENKKGALAFSLEVVRGPTFHLGNISGKAEVNRNLARYTDKADDPEKVKAEGETWLNFTRDGRFLVLAGANTQAYHGARAYFDGKYVRVGDAQPPTEEQGEEE